MRTLQTSKNGNRFIEWTIQVGVCITVQIGELGKFTDVQIGERGKQRVHPIFIRMIKNKAQNARESITQGP